MNQKTKIMMELATEAMRHLQLPENQELVIQLSAAIEEVKSDQMWMTVSMESAPKDGTPVIAYCSHESDLYFCGNGRLTTYGSFCESFSHADDGWHIIEWGGEYTESYEWGEGFTIPDWWFVHDSNFEKVANPICWIPVQIVSMTER